MVETYSVMFISLLLVNVLMYAYGDLMQYTSSLFNTRVNDTHTISVATQETSTKCCALCSMTDHCVSCSFQDMTGRCVLANRNPKLDLYADTNSETGWIAFYSSKAPCLPSWTLWESHCYFIQAADTYLESEASCLSLGGHLVDVQSQGENDFLVSIKPDVFIWIGLNDLSTEGDFRWTSNNAAPTFTSYSPNEPNGGTNEGCILSNNGFWNDSNCNETHESICKKTIY